MPVALAAAATFVHLVLVATLWFVRVPAASFLALGPLLVLAAASFLLRDREPLFLLAGLFYVAEVVLGLSFMVGLRDMMLGIALNALLGTLVALTEVLATVLFLVAFSRLVRAERRLRIGFRGVAVVAGILGAGQVVMGVWLMIGPPPDLVFQLAVLLYGGTMAWLSIAVEAVTLLLLLFTWHRHFASPPVVHEASA